jgi:hypothetical protein
MTPKKFKPKVILVGSYPPPIGGCSIHIKRLAGNIKEKFRVRVIDLYGPQNLQFVKDIVYRCGKIIPLNLLRAVLQLHVQKGDIVHFHVSSMKKFVYVGHLLLSLVSKSSKSMVTVHSGSFVHDYKKSGLLKKYLILNLLQNFSHVIVVGFEQYKLLLSEGLSDKSLSLIPAFFQPNFKTDERISRIIYEFKIKYRIIIVSSGSAVPLYGFNLILDAMEKNQDFDSFGLIFCFYNQYDEEYYKSIVNRVKNWPNIYIFKDLDPERFNYVLKECDIYIRATDRDGDCVAIREARYYGTLVIASDCTKRPNGCKLFETGNLNSLAEKVIQALSLKNVWSEYSNDSDNAAEIIKIYQRLIKDLAIVY